MCSCKLAFGIVAGLKGTPNHSSKEEGQISAAGMRSAWVGRPTSYQAMAVQGVSPAIPFPPSALDGATDGMYGVVRVKENLPGC